MIEGRDILCFSTADWDTPLPTNKHQLMTRLAAHNRVLFVETLGTRRVRWSNGTDLGRIGRRLKRLLGGVQRIPSEQWPVCSQPSAPGGRGGLWVLSPAVYPRWERPWAAAANRWMLRRQIPCAMNRLKFHDVIAWCYSPHCAWILDAVRPAKIVYHMVDDLSAAPGAEAQALRSAEEELLRRADHVFCTEETLCERARRIHPGALLMDNVADYEHFSRGEASRLSPEGRRALEAIRARPAPRILFSGNLTPHKVDFDLLDEIARRRADWSLILIGPLWEGLDPPESYGRLRERPNVLFTGLAAYADLPPLLHAADVLFIPYSINAATRHVSPLKFFEYLGTGKPIVATPLPSLKSYKDLAMIAPQSKDAPASAEAFIEGIERALRQPSSGDEGTRRRIEEARRHTWSQRLEEMCAILDTAGQSGSR